LIYQQWFKLWTAIDSGLSTAVPCRTAADTWPYKSRTCLSAWITSQNFVSLGHCHRRTNIREATGAHTAIAMTPSMLPSPKPCRRRRVGAPTPPPPPPPCQDLFNATAGALHRRHHQSTNEDLFDATATITQVSHPQPTILVTCNAHELQACINCLWSKNYMVQECINYMLILH
jgi:hypothetical protein